MNSKLFVGCILPLKQLKTSSASDFLKIDTTGSVLYI